MKAVIKILTADKEFSQDQKDILRRVSNVLMEHNLSVSVILKKKVSKKLKHLKIVKYGNNNRRKNRNQDEEPGIC